MSARRRLIRVLTTSGVLRVRTCELCAALILADAVEHHERVHAASLAAADVEAVRTNEWRDEVRR